MAPSKTPPGANEPALTHPISRTWLGVAATITGASVMVVEIVGTRVLTPFFGVGLYVWSALLVVTLGSLALGYYLGGLLADRRSRFSLPYQLLGAGLGVALAPVLRSPTLLLFSEWGSRSGALVTAVALFAPALCILGMVSTTLVKLAIATTGGAGRAAGGIYALSTLGSLAGTLAAGFWLVPSYPVNGIFWGTAFALLLTGVLLLSRKVAVLFCVAGAGFGILIPVSGGNEELGDYHVLERRQSLYGSLSVIDDKSRGTRLRVLRADHSLIGAQWATGEPAFAFVHILAAGALARPDAERALVIGLGIGSVATALVEHGISVDVAELDPGVVALAERYFGFRTNGDLYIQDARTLIRELDRRYDLIIHDTFTGGAVPEHLLSLEVIQRLSEMLTDDGILILNAPGAASGPLAPAAAAVRRTMTAVFKQVRTFSDGPIEHTGEIHNLIFFASRSPIRFNPEAQSVGPHGRPTQSKFQNWEIHHWPETAAIIRDDHNPISHLATPISERFHAKMRELYPAEFWLL